MPVTRSQNNIKKTRVIFQINPVQNKRTNDNHSLQNAFSRINVQIAHALKKKAKKANMLKCSSMISPHVFQGLRDLGASGRFKQLPNISSRFLDSLFVDSKLERQLTSIEVRVIKSKSIRFYKNANLESVELVAEAQLVVRGQMRERVHINQEDRILLSLIPD